MQRKIKPYIKTIPIDEHPDYDYISFILKDIDLEKKGILTSSFFDEDNKSYRSNLSLKKQDRILEKIENNEITVKNAKFQISNENVLKIKFLEAKENIINVSLDVCKTTTREKEYFNALVLIEQVLASQLEARKAITYKSINLTKQEYLILLLIKKLYTPVDICRLLDIKKDTLTSHLKNMSNKFLSSDIGTRYGITINNNAKKPLYVIKDFIQYGWLDNETYNKYHQKKVI